MTYPHIRAKTPHEPPPLMLPTLSLVMCVRDEAPHVEDTIASVCEFVDEMVVFDTGSVDDTFERCLALGARGVKIQTDFLNFDFGQAKTAAIWMADSAYILLLDADERLTGGEHLPGLIELMEYRNFPAIGLPRRRWADLDMIEQVEKEAYPDWQIRLFRNNPWRFRLNGALHETPSIKAENVLFPKQNPIHIEHFVDPLHLADPERRNNRAEQRMRLAMKANVPMEGSAEATRRATDR